MKRSPDYREGEREGLRIAAEAIRELERTVAERMELESGRQTRDARRVRHKALQVAARRVETIRRTKRRGTDAVASDAEAWMRRAGL